MYLVTQIHFVGKGVPERSESVLDQLLQVAVFKTFQVLLEVGPGALGSSADGHGATGVEVGGRAGLDNVGSVDVVTWAAEKASG